MKKILTARQIHEEKRIFWLKSYKAVLVYINDYAHILKPITKGTKSGKRYYIKEENVNKFVKMFENNELS